MASSQSSYLNDPKVIVALDYANKTQCLDLVKRLEPSQCRLKIGKEMFTLFGPQLVEQLHQMGFQVFLDLKFHDIPNTVAKAVAAAASLGVWMVNVHAFGGIRMMEAAKAALLNVEQAPLLIAVTVLTSMENSDIAEVGVHRTTGQQAEHLAQLAAQCELDGVVCSAQEASYIKAQCGDDFLCVTPGIRPAGAEGDDQRRIVTPAVALQNGSDYLVIGRPITQASDPQLALQQIIASLSH